MKEYRKTCQFGNCRRAFLAKFKGQKFCSLECGYASRRQGPIAYKPLEAAFARFVK